MHISREVIRSSRGREGCGDGHPRSACVLNGDVKRSRKGTESQRSLKRTLACFAFSSSHRVSRHTLGRARGTRAPPSRGSSGVRYEPPCWLVRKRTMRDDRVQSSRSVTRFTSGGVVDFSIPDEAAGSGRVVSGGGVSTSRSTAAAQAQGPNTTPNTQHPSTLNATNVGFRMLRNAGWRVGTGLGRQNQGAIEPVRVVQKTSRRGVGTAEAERRVLNVVGEERKAARQVEPGGGVWKNNKAKEAELTEKGKTKTSADNVGDAKKRGRDERNAFARAAANDLNSSGDTIDFNPLLRGRRSGHVSQNNPLRGLF